MTTPLGEGRALPQVEHNPEADAIDKLNDTVKHAPQDTDKLPPTIPGDNLVTIERTNPDGSTTRYVASHNPDKFYDLTEMGRGKVPQIGKPISTGWSHGLLDKNERIIQDGGKSGMEQSGKYAPPSASELEAPLAVESELDTGSSTVGNISKIFAETPGHILQPLFKEINEHMDAGTRDIPVGTSDKAWSGYKYPTSPGAEDDRVIINNKHINSSLVHGEEIVHAATVSKIPLDIVKARGAEMLNRIEAYRKTGDNEAVKDLLGAYVDTAKHEGLYDELFKDHVDEAGGVTPGMAGAPDELHKQYPGHTSAYAMGDPAEFIAHGCVTKEFQQLLHNLPSGTKPNTSMWQRFVDAVSRVLGVSVKNGTMLERVLRSTAELIHQERPGNEGGGKKAGTLPPREEDSTTVADLQNKLRTLQPGSPEHTAAYRQLEEVKNRNGGNVPKPIVDDSGIKYAAHPEDEEQKTGGRDILTRAAGAVTEPAIDEISRKFGKAGEIVSKALKHNFEESREVLGHWWTPLDAATSKLSEKQLKRLDEVCQLESLHDKSFMFMLRTPEERAAYNEYKRGYSEMGDLRIERKMPVYDGGVPRDLVKNEWSYPNSPNSKFDTALREGTDTKLIESGHQDFIQHSKKYNEGAATYGFDRDWSKHVESNPEDAVNSGLKKSMRADYVNTGKGYERLWNDYVSSRQGSGARTGYPSLAIFSAMTKPERIPLPDSLRNMNFRDNMFSYYRRASMALAFHDNVLNNPEAAAHLGITHDAWGRDIDTEGKRNLAGNNTVRTVLDMVHGEVEPALQRAMSSWENLANAVILGPATEVHKIFSVPGQAFGKARGPLEAIKAGYHAATNISKGWSDAMENGLSVNKPHDAMDFMRAGITWAERVNSFANTVRKIYTLNGLTERIATGYAQANCEYLVRAKIAAANNSEGAVGNDGRRVLTGLDSTFVRGKTYDDAGVSKLASRMVGDIIGTHDPRTLPAWFLHDNEISAFFKLLSWNVAQTNSFLKNQWQPALKGDLVPLVMTVFGASLGGYVIRELRSKLSGKDSNIPSLSNIASSSRGLEGNHAALFYNWISAASYGGLGGIVSLATKMPMDIHFRNAPQGAIFPLDEIVSGYANTAKNVADALVNDPNADPTKIVSRAFTDIITKNTQLGRVVMNQAINSGLVNEHMNYSALPKGVNEEGQELAFDKQRADKMLELKKFKQVEGLPVNPQTDSDTNPYLNMEQKRFQHTTDPQVAMQELPKIIQTYIDKYRATPDILMSKIEGLKANAYDVFPSLERTPLVFKHYMDYLTKEKGQEQTNQLLADYMRRKIINEAKSSAVP